MTPWKQILTKLKNEPTVSVPDAGRAFGLSENAAYRAAKGDKLGVPVMTIGGRKRVTSISVLRKLGIEGGSSN
jgi:hypothetical protein